MTATMTAILVVLGMYDCYSVFPIQLLWTSHTGHRSHSWPKD